MPALLSRVKKAVNAVLDLADAYQETPDAGSRAYEQELIDIALTIDVELIEIGLRNATWAHRVDFTQSTSVAHGANLPAHTGPIDAVIISSKNASVAPVEQIEKERELTALSPAIGVTPHYNTDGYVLSHNGTSSATVKSCIVTRGSVLQAPDELEGAIIRGVLSLISSPEGEAPEMQAAYAALYQQDKQSIATGEIPPPFALPEKAAA